MRVGNVHRIVILLFCIVLHMQAVSAKPGLSQSCIVPVLSSEWHQAKHLYDEGKCAEASTLIKTALTTLEQRQGVWRFYVNCGSMSIIDCDRSDSVERQEEDINGIKFVRAVLGDDHRELINWLYDYQDISTGKASMQACAQIEPLLKKQISIVDKVMSACQSQSAAEKIQLVKIEAEYLWKLAAILKKQGKDQECVAVMEKQANFRDHIWETKWGKHLYVEGSPSWDDTAQQYFVAGNYNKAEAIYRMLLVRVCDAKSTANLSKMMPAPSLEQILVVIDKGNYDYSRIMYLDKLKEIYIKQNQLDKAEECIRGMLASMSMFYGSKSAAIKFKKQELQELLSKEEKGQRHSHRTQ